MRFKPGQEIVCTNHYGASELRAPFPKINSIYIANEYYSDDFLTLKNFYDSEWAYCERWFEPVADISELKEILNQKPIEV